MNKEAKEISDLIHACDEDNLSGIASHILGYEIELDEYDPDIDHEIVDECDFMLEHFMSNQRILKLHQQIFKN
jgi:hypothetical protein